MDKIDESKLYTLYTLSELAYEKHFSGINQEELYPTDWYAEQKYKEKIEIIAEAIKTNSLIEKTTKYINFKSNNK